MWGVNVTKVAVLMGGRSGEHQVSLKSAGFIIQALKEADFAVVPIGITNQGRWLYHEEIASLLLSKGDLSEALPVTLDLCYQGAGLVCRGKSLEVDVVFPVLHGPFGEDGTVQGALEVAGLPYVGSGVLGSALAMDKAHMKGAFARAGLPIGEYVSFSSWQWQQDKEKLLQRIEDELGLPVFVKPANLGSSVGITKAKDSQSLAVAVDLAFEFDSKVMVEAAIEGRELECSVLGNQHPRVSVPGEIIPSQEFYDYQAKYIDAASRLVIPASVDPEVALRAQQLALRAFTAVDARGLARVDMFLQPDGKVLLNEINTMPGFTAISMYPKLWEASGVDAPLLVRELVELGLAEHRRRSQLRHCLEQEGS